MKDAVSLLGSNKLSGAHVHILCLDQFFLLLEQKPLSGKKKLRDVKGDLKNERESLSELFEFEDLALCVASTLVSTVVTFVEAIFTTRLFWK